MPKKLCKIAKDQKKKDLKKLKELVGDSKYYCKKCWRTAADKDNLCKPEEL